VEALEHASRKRWGGNQELREAAERALNQLRRRRERDE
jgi:hypothetical protein